MKILIYGLNYAPELTGVGRYTGRLASWLAQRGYQVRCVTALPYYPKWRIDDGYRPRRYCREVIDGVAVTRCPLWVPGRPASVTRILHLLSSPSAAWCRCCGLRGAGGRPWSGPSSRRSWACPAR